MIKLLRNNACCTDPTSGGTQGSDCVDSWKNELKTVANEYNNVSAEADRSEDNYKNAFAWKEKLKTWLANLDKANQSALDISTEVTIFIEQVNNTCFNTECTAKAVYALLCEIKSIFDSFYTYSNQTGLKDQVAELRKNVDCLKDLDPAIKTEILACIDDYDAKNKAVCALQNDLLKKLVDMYKCINLLYASVCEEDGLSSNLNALKEEFPTELVKQDPNQPPVSTGTGLDIFPCDIGATKPKPQMPIGQSDFYKQVSADFDSAVMITDQLKVAWDAKRIERDKLLARKNSLMDAIKAAEAAETGK